MVAVFIHYPHTFLPEVLVYGFSSTQLHTVIRPRRSLGLEVETNDVGSQEGSLRWAVGMEAHVVQSVSLASLEKLSPRSQVHWRIACIREVAVLHRSAQNHLPAVDVEHLATYLHLTHSELSLMRICMFGCLCLYAECIKLRVELVPQQHAVAHIECDVKFIGSLRIQCHNHRLCTYLMITTRIESRSLQCQRHLTLLLQSSVQHKVYTCFLIVYIRIYLHLTDTTATAYLHITHDTVPVALCLVCHRVGVLSYLHCLGVVVDAYGYLVVTVLV